MPAYIENHKQRMAYEVIDRRKGTVVSTHATRRKAWNASNKIERTPSLRTTSGLLDWRYLIRATPSEAIADAREALRVHTGLVVR